MVSHVNGSSEKDIVDKFAISNHLITRYCRCTTTTTITTTSTIATTTTTTTIINSNNNHNINIDISLLARFSHEYYFVVFLWSVRDKFFFRFSGPV